MRRMWIAMVVIGLASIGCSKKEQAGAAGTDEGVEAANAWLSIV